MSTAVLRSRIADRFLLMLEFDRDNGTRQQYSLTSGPTHLRKRRSPSTSYHILATATSSPLRHSATHTGIDGCFMYVCMLSVACSPLHFAAWQPYMRAHMVTYDTLRSLRPTCAAGRRRASICASLYGSLWLLPVCCRPREAQYASLYGYLQRLLGGLECELMWVPSGRPMFELYGYL